MGIGFRLALPYVAVGLGWSLGGSAWLAIGLYHCGILALGRAGLAPAWRFLRRRGVRCRWLPPLVLVGFSLLFVPLSHVLLRPDVDPGAWLAARGLGGASLWIFALVYGVAHPVLEELHFQPLRRKAWVRTGDEPRATNTGDRPARWDSVPWTQDALVAAAFAGYHLVVLAQCFRATALPLAFLVLFATSWGFGVLDRTTGGGRVSYGAHAAADAVVAIVALVWGGAI